MLIMRGMHQPASSDLGRFYFSFFMDLGVLLSSFWSWAPFNGSAMTILQVRSPAPVRVLFSADSPEGPYSPPLFLVRILGFLPS